MSNPFPPPFALPGDGDEPTTVDEDGEKVLDPDADPDAVDSATADRLAADGDADTTE